MPPCNGCTYCCKLMGVPELKKMPGKWCGHCDPGKGCRIYDDRPHSCIEFECFYRSEKADIPLALRPDKCKVVIAPTTNSKVISAHVDPGYPTAWRDEPIYGVLKNIANDGFIVVIGIGTSINKVALKSLGHGVVGHVPIQMSPADENGMQWFDDRKLPELGRADGGANITMIHTNINTPKGKP